jgi:hypothetical protein
MMQLIKTVKIHCLFDIPVKLSSKKVENVLRLKKLRGVSDDAEKIINEVLPLIKARAAYRVCYITKRGKDWIQLEGRRFASRILRDNVRDIERVFPYIITIGDGVESRVGDETELLKQYDENELLKQYFMETVADMALISARAHFLSRLKKKYRIKRLSNMSPGSLKDWPITEQRPLFDLMEEGSINIQVQLTETMLMLPRKSLSGIYFSTEKDFVSCQLCSRKNCSGRMAEFDEKMYERYQVD